MNPPLPQTFYNAGEDHHFFTIKGEIMDHRDYKYTDRMQIGESVPHFEEYGHLISLFLPLFFSWRG